MVTVDSHQPLPSIGMPSAQSLKQPVKQQHAEVKKADAECSAPAATDVSLLCSLLHASRQLEQGIDIPPTYESVASSGTAVLTSAHVMQLSGENKAAAQPGGEGKDVNTVFPRRKAGQDSRTNSQPVVLSEQVLRGLFCLPLQEACSKLGICATALKKACRKLGIKKWPYRTSKASPMATSNMPATDDVVLFQETAEWFRAKEVAHAPAYADKAALISVSSLIN